MSKTCELCWNHTFVYISLKSYFHHINILHLCYIGFSFILRPYTCTNFSHVFTASKPSSGVCCIAQQRSCNSHLLPSIRFSCAVICNIETALFAQRRRRRSYAGSFCTNMTILIPNTVYDIVISHVHVEYVDYALETNITVHITGPSEAAICQILPSVACVLY